MGVDLVLYRQRIGKLGPGKPHRQKQNDGSYSPYCNSADIQYNMFATMLFAWSILSIFQYVQSCNQTCNTRYIVGDLICGQIKSENWPMCFDFSSTTPLPSNVNEHLAHTSILLSYDVETNPGPTDLDDVIQAIQSSETKVLLEVRSMKDDISEIKSDLSSLKLENEQMKMNMKSMHGRQSSLAELINNTNKNVDQLQECSENLRLDVDHINDLAEKNSMQLENLEDDLDRLNIAQISANMRVFGLDIKKTDSEKDVEYNVIKHVLKKAYPGGDWVSEDIKRVQIISESEGDKSSLVIVHFRYDDDKFKIYSGRQELRKFGLRVGDDLTYRQRQKLKLLKKNGKTGYFFKGKLHIREENDTDTLTGTNDARFFRQATRKTLPEQDNIVDEDDISDMLTDHVVDVQANVD